MKKDKYFTIENRAAKTAEWKEILSEYYTKKKKFQFDFESTALFVIDMQEYFLSSSSHAYLPAAEAIIEPVKKLQQAFQEKSSIIYFTQYGLHPDVSDTNMMKRWWKGSLTTDDPLYAISSKFDLTDVSIQEKDTYDAFACSNLALVLNKLGYDKIVITGVTTHLCCDSTARNAFDYGLEVYMVIDCMATYTEELHLNTLKAASHGYGIPITSDEILELM